MPSRGLALSLPARLVAWTVAVLALTAVSAGVAQAQNNNNQGYNRAVGGISINVDGLLDNATQDDRGELRRVLQDAMRPVPADLKTTSPLRKVSLARLDAALQKALAEGREIPDAARYLAGLQQIRYVLVYPDQKDIVLAGPGEGWTVDARGTVIGQTTQRPVMLLDDLLVALRAALSPQRDIISCSIDPTAEGLQRLTQVTRKLSASDPGGSARVVEQQLGPQKITFTGVPESSHFARVLVAADYRMKRISMDLERAPIANLPSFLSMASAGGSGMRNMLPRWWLAPNYQPLLKDAEGTAWELRGASVQAMAENDFFNASGVREKTVAADPVSQRWADQMTRRYEDLAKAEPVFGQLRNCMDLALVGALVAKENLLGRAGCELGALREALQTMQLTPPKQIASKASLVHKGRKWMIAAGGVQINPWDTVRKAELSEKVAGVRSQAASGEQGNWWWD